MRPVLLAAAVLAAMVALAFAWPAIGAGWQPRGQERTGGWYPEDDPGTLLVLAHQGRVERYAFGAEHYCADLDCEPARGFLRFVAKRYVESDGRAGGDGEGGVGTFSRDAGNPESGAIATVGPGYRGGCQLDIRMQFGDGQSTRAILGPPLSPGAGASTPWQLLVALPELGVLLEWSQTPEHLLIRRSALPEVAPPAWAGASFRVREAACTFADGTQIARLFRARVPRLPDGDCNVQVQVAVDDAGAIRTDVVAR